MTDQSHDRFTLPRDIPDAAFWAPGDTLADAARKRDAARAEEARERGYSAAHPAGRGWVPHSRDLGIPSEHESTRAPGTVFHNGVEHSFPHGIPEDVVAATGHSAVFTTERRVRFLDHLAFKGNVRAAAALVGVSHETAYRKRRQDAKFAALWDAAMVQARAYAEQVVATRALDGVEVPIVHRGEIVAYKTVHDPRWMNLHFTRLDKKVDEDAAAMQCAGRFEELLAEYAGHEAPEGFAEAAREARDWRERDAAPELPPTREEYVNWRRGEAMGGKSAKAEAARMHAAGETAGAEWDAWHAGALAKVGAIVEGEDEAPSPVGRGRGPAGEAGWEGEGERDLGDDPHPTLSHGERATDDLPYEIKSAPEPRGIPPLGTVSQVSTPRSAHALSAGGSPL
jgi:hypothetical protein